MPAPTRCRLLITLLVVLVPLYVSPASAGMLVHFPADGSLAATGGAGSALQATCTAPDALAFEPGREGQGARIAPNAAVRVPVPDLSPQHGTLCFWFKPDWSPNTCTPFDIFSLSAGDDFTLLLKRGWTSPDDCYLNGKTNSVFKIFPSTNLFTAHTWRHYAVRWSAEAGTIDVVVDGDVEPRRTGKYSTEATGAVDGVLTLLGSARGAFYNVKVFDEHLGIEQLIAEGGLTRIARYLQRQAPPGATDYRPTEPEGISYVSVDEWRKLADGPEEPLTYNPADHPDLPHTPHTKWARPLAGGPVRVLFIMPVGFFNERSTIREVVEFWQRVDSECLATQQLTAEVVSQDWDAIVITQQGYQGRPLGWTDIDQSLRQWVLERVTTGRSGLVYAYPIAMDEQINAVFSEARRIEPDEVLRGFPTAAMHRVDGSVRHNLAYTVDDDWFAAPDTMRNEIVQVYADDTIRAVKLDYTRSITGWWAGIPAITPDTSTNAAATDVQYDHWQALAARAVLFAAGRLDGPRITEVLHGWGQLDVGTEGTPPGATISMVIRDRHGRVYRAEEGPVAAPGGWGYPRHDRPPRAVYDLILRNASGEVLDWYCAAPGGPTAPPGARGIRLDGRQFRSGDTVTGTVYIGSARNAGLDVYLVDHGGRRVASHHTELAIDEREQAVPFALGIPRSSDSLLMRVEAMLRTGLNTLYYDSIDCPVPSDDNDGFYACMYGAGLNRHLDRQRIRWFRDEFGIDCFMQGRSTPNLARENLRTIEYMFHLGYPANEETLAKWMEPWDEFFTKERISDPLATMLYRPIFYSLGEEHFMLMGSSEHPEVNARFRKYLQQKHGTLERLNEVWGTGYSSWDDVHMLSPHIVDTLKIEQGVIQHENRRFMEHLFTAKHAYLAERLRELDPEGMMGIHAGWDLWMGRGYDYWLLSRALDAMMGYSGPQNQYMRSFCERHFGCWFHYNMGSVHDVRWHPWYMLMSGAHGFGWYTIAPQIWGATTADMQLSSDWEACKDEIRDVGDIGDLLVKAEYQDDQVAVHYSQDSYHTGMIGLGINNLSWVHQAFTNLLFDAGVPHRWVSYEQLANGEVTPERFKVLILPHSRSMSAAEVARVRAYVEAGGLLWADEIPATHDESGRKLEQSALADLFAGLSTEPLSGPTTRGQTPMPPATIEVGKHGRGTVVLAPIGNYNYDRNVGEDLVAQQTLTTVVNGAGVQRVARVTDADTGLPANGVWCAGWRAGAQRYIVVARDWQLADRAPARVRIELDEPGHVYEMRSGEYLGQVGVIPAELHVARGRVYAILPYRVEGLTADIRNEAVPGSDLVCRLQVQTDGRVGSDDIHLARCRVAGPDGEEVVCLRRNVELRGGRGTLRIPIAYDDAPGEWTVNLQLQGCGTESLVTYSL